MTIYDQAALRRIGNAIGPCLDGRDQGEMLECIDRAAQGFITAERGYDAKRRATMCAQLEETGAPPDLLEYIRSGGQDAYLRAQLEEPDLPKPSGTDDRRRLRAAAAALRRAAQMLKELGPIGAGHLAWEEVENGLKVSAGRMADTVDAAAEGLPVKPGPEPSAFDRFVRELAGIVEHFAGWRRKSTHTRNFVDAPPDAPIELVMEVERSESLYGGKFFAVVKACAEPLGIKKRDAALDRAIRRALSPDKLSN